MDSIEHATELPRYADWAPPAHDCRGLGLPDRQDWRVLPVTRTRDSGPLDESNFESACAAFDATGPGAAAWEVHRFGHWGPGWIEILLVNPDCPDALRAAGEIVCALADYPILDEDDFSRREADEIDRAWDAWGHEACVDALCSAVGIDRLSHVRDLLLGAGDALWGLHADRTSGDHCDDEGAHFDFDWCARYSRDGIAQLVRGIRREARAAS